MMNSLIAQLLLLQIALPLLIVVVNAFTRPLSIMAFWFRTIGIFLLLLYTALSGVWLFPPWWTPYLLILVHIVGSVYCFRQRARRRKHKSKAVRVFADTAIGIVLVLTGIYLLLPVITGRTPPTELVELASPLGTGRYLVTSGGTTGALNNHLKTLQTEKFREYRGQSYAVDLIGVDPFGFRSKGISPQDPMAYHIYGKPVLAPCDGNVSKASDGIPDMPVPKMDREHMLGNHVLLECTGYTIVLAHMAKGSVAVTNGQQVKVGDLLGHVGNSGNTAETHLHVHVQKTLPENQPLSGEPLWFTIDNRFLVRNDILVVQ